MLEYLALGLILYFTLRYYLRTLMIDHYEGRHVMITGCDSGFGFMLAKKLDSMGFTVFAGCLTEKGGKELKSEVSGRVRIVPLDVTSTKSIEEALMIVKKALPSKRGLWGLVNNAGIAGGIGHVEWMTLEDYRHTMDINCFGMVETSRVFLPLVTKEKGRIVFITSMMGRIAAAGAPYVASKFAAEGYCDCLRRNVRNMGVTVHILEPGFFATNITNTDSTSRNIDNCFKNANPSVQKFYGEQYRDKLKDMAVDLLGKFTSKDTHKVVNAYTHALCAKYPKYRYVVGIDANTIFRFLWNVPECISDFLMDLGMPFPDGAK